MANKPNEQFQLTVEDLEHIEYALRLRMTVANMEQKKEINQLLGKLHNQKNWYRSKSETYVSG